MAVLVAGDVREALHEAGQGADSRVVLDDVVLPGKRQGPLDDHVVERDRLDEGLRVLGLGGEAVDAVAEHAVEQLGERVGEVPLERAEPLGHAVGAVEHAHLGEEAVEELDVAGLVGDLRGEEDALLLGRARPHDRAELVGDPLLSREEGGKAEQALDLLVVGDALVPVDAVLAEVDVLGRPLLALPELVQLDVAQELRPPAIGRGLERRIRRGEEVLALGDRGERLHWAQRTKGPSGQNRYMGQNEVRERRCQAQASTTTPMASSATTPSGDASGSAASASTTASPAPF